MSDEFGIGIGFLMVFMLIVFFASHYLIQDQSTSEFERFIVPELWSEINMSDTDVHNLEKIETICALDRRAPRWLSEPDCIHQAKDWYVERKDILVSRR